MNEQQVVSVRETMNEPARRTVEDASKNLGIQTVADLRNLELSELEAQFGRYGMRLHELGRGMDTNPVLPDRPTQSISVEDTLEEDVPLEGT